MTTKDSKEKKTLKKLIININNKFNITLLDEIIYGVCTILYWVIRLTFFQVNSIDIFNIFSTVFLIISSILLLIILFSFISKENYSKIYKQENDYNSNYLYEYYVYTSIGNKKSKYIKKVGGNT
ncbi:hypothetical protein SAMN02910370_02187 [Lachnospiraceae bacterium XPB1003]|nr:hypothetical protein SAMN02910370_02187 [Lachnospiraceae bacterium XPB1003]